MKNPPGTVVQDEKLPPQPEGQNDGLQAVLRALVGELDGIDTWGYGYYEKIYVSDLKKVLDKYRKFC